MTYSTNGWIVGDSITNLGKDNFLTKYHPSFDVNAVNGRDVNTLPGLIDARLAAAPCPKWMVFALGTNVSPGWTKDDYAACIDKVPTTKNVVLVTCYRDPDVFGEAAAQLALDYTRWMKALALERPNVHIASWRYWIEQNRDHLTDGVHPDGYAQGKWAYLLDRAIDNCGGL